MALHESVAEIKDKRLSVNNGLSVMIKSLMKFWWLFLVVAILAGIGGIIYASNQKILYKSRLTFALDDGDGNGMGSFINLASQFGLNINGGKDIFLGDNILEIMKSRRMLERVLLSVDTFDNKPSTLIEFYLNTTDKYKNDKIKDIRFPVGQPRSGFSYRQDSLLYTTYMEFIKKGMEAQRPDRKLGIYEVSVTSPDEKFTKVFTDRIVSETNNFYIEIRTKKAKETLEILENRVADMKGNLNSSISKRATVQDVNVNPAFSAAQIPVMQQQANIQTYGAAYGEMFKNLELARFQYLNQIPLMLIIDSADYPMQKIKWGKLQTGIIWALAATFFIAFIFWIVRVVKYSRRDNIK